MKRLGEILRGVAALIVVIAIVVGSPFVLVRVGRIDALLASLQRGTFVGYGGETLLGVITLVAWLAWALATLSILVELLSALSGQRMRLPGTGVFAPASAVLVTAILGLAASGGVAGAHQHMQPWQAEPVSVVSSSTAAAAPSEDGQRQDAIMAQGLRSGLSRAAKSDAEVRVHTVKAGEDLWSLAEKFLGDGFRWRELAELNDTTLLNPTAALQEGMQLFVPVAIEGDANKPEGDPHQAKVIQQSDAAQDLDRVVEGVSISPSSAQSDGDENVGGAGAAGTVTPCVDPSEQRGDGSEHTVRLDQTDSREVVVEAGDSLWTIAERELGDGQAWPQIAALNADRIEDPDQIDVGWRLNLPANQAKQFDDLSQESETSSDQVDAEAGTDPGQAEQPDTTQLDPSWPGESSETEDLEAQDPEQCMQPETTVRPQTEQPNSAESADSDEQDATEQVSPSIASVLNNVAALAGVSATLAATLAAALRLRRGRQLAQLPLGHRLRVACEPHEATAAALLTLADQDELWRPPKAGDSSAETPHGFADADLALRVRLGETADQKSAIWMDIAERSLVSFVGDEDECVGLATAVVLQLIGEENATQIVVGGPSFDWLTSLDEPRLVITGHGDARQQLVDVLGERLAALPGKDTLQQLQSDPTTAAAWSPYLFVFDADPQLAELDPAQLARCGVSVLVCCSQSRTFEGGPSQVIEVETLQATLPDGTQFIPDHVSKPARRALAELFDEAGQQEFEPAEWWSNEPSIASNVIALSTHQIKAPAQWQGAEDPQRLEFPLPISQQSTVQSSPLVPGSRLDAGHPFLRMLGPVELIGTHGDPPQRAVKQCAEYCAWLLEHPGASAPAMARSLLVAETTRRSNMSRLRSWLGVDEQGSPYLPEAYSGRIFLHPAISSDWEQFGLLLGAGVNRASDEALTSALELVRGAPLADAAPGQWHWAEQLRADMAAMIRDVAYLLSTRKLEAGDHEAARWAANRGLLASPEDEQLLGVKLQIEHRAGNRLEVDRLVLHITRQARILGVDLMDETVELLQQVVEGQARSRMA